MRLDAQTVKERVSLKEIFERDGHELRRMGPNFICRCPVHNEKTASCVVHEEEAYFKCHGCGVGGDCFVYWQKTRGCEFTEALKALAGMVGLTSGGPMPAPRVLPKPEQAEVMAPVLGGADLKRWEGAIAELREDGAQQERIASWRGYSVELVRWANAQGLLGMILFAGAWREAFLVERPDGEGRLAIGYHVRLAPRTPWNDSEKASWRYVPQGIGAWPFVVGAVRSAKVLFFLEGQWDALAFVDAMWRGAEVPRGVAIVGMRGATSWKRFVQGYQWPAESTAFALGQADRAGRGWFDEGGLIEALRVRCSRVWAFWPFGSSGADFNDLWKMGAFTGDDLRLMFRGKMVRRSKGRRNPGMTFLQFCRAEKARVDNIGEIARQVVTDTRAPRGRKPLRDWERYLGRYMPEEMHPAFHETWRAWQRRVHELKEVAA